MRLHLALPSADLPPMAKHGTLWRLSSACGTRVPCSVPATAFTKISARIRAKNRVIFGKLVLLRIALTCRNDRCYLITPSMQTYCVLVIRCNTSGLKNVLSHNVKIWPPSSPALTRSSFHAHIPTHLPTYPPLAPLQQDVQKYASTILDIFLRYSARISFW